MSGAASVEKCANPNCTAKFKKLDEGFLFAETVDDPAAWSLPSGKKQKVVWLCATCAKTFDLEFDSAQRVILRPRQALRVHKKSA